MLCPISAGFIRSAILGAKLLENYALLLASSNPTKAAQLAEKARAARESHAANESAFA
jgi:hypothetical protein